MITKNMMTSSIPSLTTMALIVAVRRVEPLTTRVGARGSGGGGLVGAGARGRCAGPARSRHARVPVEVRAFLDDQCAGVDLARDASGRTDLHSTFAEDLAINLACDRYLLRGEARRHACLFLDDDRALAFDFALDGAQQAHRALGLERALEAGVLADQALNFGAIDHRPHGAAGQADVYVHRGRTITRAGARGLTGHLRPRTGGCCRVAGFRHCRRGSCLVTVLGQRAAEPSPFLFFGFLEHLAPPSTFGLSGSSVTEYRAPVPRQGRGCTISCQIDKPLVRLHCSQ